jgi:hypothetical protein
MSRMVCVFCSSSNRAPPEYFAAAEELGRLLAARGWTLVYGGGSVGLMGALARTVHAHGGKVIGILPERLRTSELAYEDADELVITADMAERKCLMIERSDAFVCLPGAFGTLDELFEVLTLKQLSFHDKPIALVDTNGFWLPLLEYFERLYAEKLSPEESRKLYLLVGDPAEALRYIDECSGATAR